MPKLILGMNEIVPYQAPRPYQAIENTFMDILASLGCSSWKMEKSDGGDLYLTAFPLHCEISWRYRGGSLIYLERVFTPGAFRDKGAARQSLTLFLTACDRETFAIEVQVNPESQQDHARNLQRMRSWFERLGFQVYDEVPEACWMRRERVTAKA